MHKRRNVGDHLPEAERRWVDARLAKAFNHGDPSAGLRMAGDLARQLETRWPGAAASLREGLEEMFTVRRLGMGDRLARTLTSTNPIESMISVGRSTTHNVKRWPQRHDGEALGRGRDAQRRAQLPAGEGLQGDAESRRGAPASCRPSCHTLMRQ